MLHFCELDELMHIHIYFRTTVTSDFPQHGDRRAFNQ